MLWEGFPGGTLVTNPPANAGDAGFPWVLKILWRRKWPLIPIFLPGKSCGWRSLVGCSSWGHKELDRIYNKFLRLWCRRVFNHTSRNTVMEKWLLEVWTNFQVLIKFVAISLLFYISTFWLWGMWDWSHFPDQELNLHPLHWEVKS